MTHKGVKRRPVIRARAVSHVGKLTLEDYLFLFFEGSETSRAAGRDFWLRRHLRTVDVEPSSSAQASQAQRSALVEWKTPRGERFEEIKEIRQPTLVVSGRKGGP